jgi:hypothetical protein
MTELIASVGPVATGDAYASVLQFKVPSQTSKMMIHLKEQDTDAVTWKILGSIDNVNFSEEMAEEEVLEDGFDTHEVTKAWLFIDVQVKSTVPESPGSVSVAVSGSG